MKRKTKVLNFRMLYFRMYNTCIMQVDIKPEVCVCTYFRFFVCSRLFDLFTTFWFLTCLLLFNSISAYQNCIPEKLRKKTRMWLYRVRSNKRKHRSQAKAPAAKSADNYNEIQKLTVSFSEGINSIGGVQNISNAALNVGVNLPDKWKVAARARGGHLSWSRT